MYEQHFGLRGRPFAMTPDADFYFEGRGNRRAFAYVRHAVLEGESFVVLTGDTGVGKTTLVYKLLEAVESQPIVSALLAGTQLDAAQLLAAILAAFRTDVAGDSLAELRAGLQAFLTTVTASGRRALIVVDEAQHLLPDAVRELIGLATMQSRRESPLQVLLVGQPELRATLGSMASGAMREPVFLFCDLGRLSAAETRSYIEHRLRHVEWEQSPLFSNEAHERIYEATDGVPRRINRLCDRLLTAAFQQQLGEVSAKLVQDIDEELRSEVGDLDPSASDGAELVSSEQEVPAPSPSGASGDAGGSLQVGASESHGADRPVEPASPELATTAEVNRRSPRTSVAAKRALVGAVMLLLLSLGFWWAYDGHSRDEKLSTLAEATRSAGGKVTSQREARATPSPPPTPIREASPPARVPAAVAPAEPPVTALRESPPLSAAPETPPAATVPDVRAAVAAATDLQAPSQGDVGVERDRPRASRAETAAKPTRARASRRQPAPAVGASEQPRQSEPSAPAAQTRPVPGACNAAVIALGLCSTP